ncbi:Root cap [Spatholobus suberectus]|nr:Root cap [Spatholobus suberectus]
MEITKGSSILIVVLCFVSCLSQANAYYYRQCSTKGTRCYGKYIACPTECPSSESTDPKAKVCQINCDKPICKAVCRSRKPNCNARGSGCYDPRFIGGDGRVFYVHGKSNEHFTLVSDSALQINARFMDTGQQTPQWNENVDHLKFTYNGNHLVLPEDPLSTWHSPLKDVKVERVAARNNAIVTLEDVAEILVNVVPVSKEDDTIHNYQVPNDDCFAHLEVQFRFFALSPKVDGVLGRTYREDFENPAKPGVAMPVVGGEDTYRTTSLLSPYCAACVFSHQSSHEKDTNKVSKLKAPLIAPSFLMGWE